MPSRPTTERRFATVANKVNRLFNSRVYVPTGTINSPTDVIRLQNWFPYLKAGIRCLKAKSGLKVCTVSGMLKKPSGLRDLHWVWVTGLKNPIGYPLTACPDYMKQRLLETLATDIYFPLKKA